MTVNVRLYVVVIIIMYNYIYFVLFVWCNNTDYNNYYDSYELQSSVQNIIYMSEVKLSLFI